jgi:hypothetical protein
MASFLVNKIFSLKKWQKQIVWYWNFLNVIILVQILILLKILVPKSPGSAWPNCQNSHFRRLLPRFPGKLEVTKKKWLWYSDSAPLN